DCFPAVSFSEKAPSSAIMSCAKQVASSAVPKDITVFLSAGLGRNRGGRIGRPALMRERRRQSYGRELVVRRRHEVAPALAPASRFAGLRRSLRPDSSVLLRRS